ncbi:OprD family outer membrane porin [Thalassotalea agariperforans]
MKLIIAFIFLVLLFNYAQATDHQAIVFGEFRAAYLSGKDNENEQTTSNALGGKIGGETADWHGIHAGATIFTTHKLFDNQHVDFFASDHQDYTLLGEVFIQASINNTLIKTGRFQFDSPFADTDDYRMVPNTFSGIMVNNHDIQDTSLFLLHFKQWAGVDSAQPESFTDINGEYGITAVGAIYQGLESIAIQSWYYHAGDFVDLFYLDASYEKNHLSLGLQLGKQRDRSETHSGESGRFYGIMASYQVADFIFESAYNHVFGTVNDGFGGGPYFTSAEFYTIDGVANQRALAVRVNYLGITDLVLAIRAVNFSQSTNEVDYRASWLISEQLSVNLIYHDLKTDGELLFAVLKLTW